jgi:hypothetical protein
VFELLTQQYEIARIEEAKDVPVVTVIDTPGIPERKFFPPRLLLTLLLTFLAFAATSALIVIREHWRAVDSCDPRKELAIEILSVVRRRLLWMSRRGHGVS